MILSEGKPPYNLFEWFECKTTDAMEAEPQQVRRKYDAQKTLDRNILFTTYFNTTETFKERLFSLKFAEILRLCL